MVERNNHVLSGVEGNELVATWGNLANRMPSFAYKRFDGKVPEPGELDDEDRALLAKVKAGFGTVVGDTSARPWPRNWPLRQMRYALQNHLID